MSLKQRTFQLLSLSYISSTTTLISLSIVVVPIVSVDDRPYPDVQHDENDDTHNPNTDGDKRQSSGPGVAGSTPFHVTGNELASGLLNETIVQYNI
jgi:hypothetical protein